MATAFPPLDDFLLLQTDLSPPAAFFKPHRASRGSTAAYFLAMPDGHPNDPNPKDTTTWTQPIRYI